MVKKILLCTILFVIATTVLAQQQTYDLVTYTPPKGWTKEEKKNVIIFTKTDIAAKTWCQIGVYKSTVSKGSIEEDIKSEWNDLVVNYYKVTDSLQATETQEAEGWKIKAASGKFTFDNQPAAVMLTTFSGYNYCVSIIATTNSESYISAIEKFIETIDLKITDIVPEANTQVPATNMQESNNPANADIAGTWIKAGSVTPEYGSPASLGAGGSTKDEYIFNANGTYVFYSKVFGYSVKNLILVKESGNYSVNGNTLTIKPKTSIVESWSKKDGTDKWGNLVESVKRNLENVTYTFTKHYFSGIQQWNLILQTARPTNRDGSYGENPAFSNAYFFAPPSINNTPIDLPPGY
jgi:hypothetical protein